MSDLVPVHAGELAIDGDPLDGYVELFVKLFRTNTQTAYRTDIASWRAYCHRERNGRRGDMATAQRGAFLDWCAEMKKPRPETGEPYAATTRARRESAVTSFYDYLTDIRVPHGNPAHNKGAKQRTRPGRPNKPTPALTADQGRAIVRAAQIRGLRDYLVVSTLYSTGIRISELINATVGDINGDSGRVTLHVERKGGKSGDVEPDPETGDLLVKWCEGRAPSEPLIPSVRPTKDGSLKPMSRDEASWYAEASGKALDLDWVTPHVLRTSAINRLREAKFAPEEVQAFAGHAVITTTALYFRRAAEAEQRAKMADAMGETMRGEAS